MCDVPGPTQIDVHVLCPRGMMITPDHAKARRRLNQDQSEEIDHEYKVPNRMMAYQRIGGLSQPIIVYGTAAGARH